MVKIFISYRRADSQSTTGRIYDRLVEAFGNDHVFKDVDRIPPGSTFSEVLDTELGRCDVLLVVMGKIWASITNEDGSKRLDNPDDFVRMEVERGLRRSDVLVIPVIVEGAAVPSPEELPVGLQELPSRQIVQVRYDPDFHRDMDRLIAFLKELPAGDSQTGGRRSSRRMLYIAGAILAALVIIAVALIANGMIAVLVQPTPDLQAIARTIVARTEIAERITATPNETVQISMILTDFVNQTSTAQATQQTATERPSETPTATLEPTENLTASPLSTPFPTNTNPPTATPSPTNTANVGLTATAQVTETAAAIQALQDAEATVNSQGETSSETTAFQEYADTALYPMPLADYEFVRGFTTEELVHWGVDLGAIEGEPIHAGPAGGLVIIAAECVKCNVPGKPSSVLQGFSLGDSRVLADPSWNYGYGHYIIVRYLNRQLPASTRDELERQGIAGGHLYCMYARLQNISVAVGTVLKGDEVFAVSGNSGASQGPHLHLECRASVSETYSSWAAIKAGLVDPLILFERE